MGPDELKIRFEMAEDKGQLHLVKSRTVYAPDIAGIVQICKDNKNICFIKIMMQPDHTRADEYFYECDDPRLAAAGRHAIEEKFFRAHSERRIK